MEVVQSKPLLPPKSHPNYRLWANYADFALERGQLVCDILESFAPVQGLKILDIGCGEGGTSLALSQRGAEITAIDFNPVRVEKLANDLKDSGTKFSVQRGDAQVLTFDNGQFDCVILQDVLEHLHQPAQALREASRVLKKGGLLYLSTPNRWSPLNFFSDPHWNLPLVSTLPRKGVEYFITKIARREKNVRADFAALLSFPQLTRLLKAARFTFQMVNKTVAAQLFRNSKAVVNKDTHLKIARALRKLHLEKLIVWLVKDELGFFNTFLNPTWYLVAEK
ncbi:MAG: class I SAM-dependent methyltransferase [bacterium]